MKNIRQCLAAIALTCVFTASTFAGQIDTVIAQPPPPPPSEASAGDMTTMIAGQMDTLSSEAVDPVAQAALSLFQSALSLF
jgi:hypothetical protein